MVKIKIIKSRLVASFSIFLIASFPFFINTFMRFKTLISESLLLEKHIPELTVSDIQDIFDEVVTPFEKSNKENRSAIRSIAFCIIYTTGSWKRFKTEVVAFANSDYYLGKVAKSFGLKDVDSKSSNMFVKKAQKEFKSFSDNLQVDIKKALSEALKKKISEKTKQIEMDLD